MCSQYLQYCQALTRPVASFSFANQDVVICIASEQENRNADAGTRHDDSWPEEIPKVILVQTVHS